MIEEKKAIIFDLDGTLLDTSPGIFGSVRYAEQQMKLPPVDDLLLPQFVGPPPKEMYMKIYGLTTEEALSAVSFHREYGIKKAIYEAEVYAGIPETLSELRKRGYKLAVATLKKQSIAEVILENFKLAQYFDSIVGMNDEENLTKKDTIELAMNQTDSSRAVMIGDSYYDYLGAKEADVEFIGVLYGFGFDQNSEYDFSVVYKPGEILDVIEEQEVS